MEMNYFKKTGKMMVAACMLAGLPFIPGTVSASELQTQMMSVQMESTTLKDLSSTYKCNFLGADNKQ